jgi:hypothetical protein
MGGIDRGEKPSKDKELSKSLISWRATGLAVGLFWRRATVPVLRVRRDDRV